MPTLKKTITEENKLIDAGVKQVCDKISFSPKESVEECRTWMGNEDPKTNKEAMTTTEPTKENKKHKTDQNENIPKKTKKEKSDNTIWRNKSTDIRERRVTQKIPGLGQAIQTYQKTPE